MQKVSNAYRASMKSPLRERAYIMLSFGLVNQEAQANAKIDGGEFSYFSNLKNIFTGENTTNTYATLEENFTKVDGSMFFLPREDTSTTYFDTGLVSENLVSDAVFELMINLNTMPTDFKGLTIDFGDNYPVDFDVVCGEQVVEFRDNTMGKFVTEEVFENATQVKLIVYNMKNPQSRVRIYSILFGYGLAYRNKDVIGSSLESYVSPIGADVPQIDFTVEIKNHDRYFDTDNPNSAINFFETGQEMEIRYGYQLPDSNEIEWIKGNHLLCSEWEADDNTATIRCCDVFRNMESEFHKGTYDGVGKSYYELATEVLQDAGIVSYYIDPQLKDLYTKNPIPRVSHKEALQIIANACRCVLSQGRNGEIRIKSSFAPDVVLTKTGEDEISNENCEFATNPFVTIEQEVACMYYGAKFVFGQAIPAEFIIRTYNDGSLVTEYTAKADEIDKVTVIHHDFDDFDKMTVEFTKTAEPYTQIVVDDFSFGDITDFTMTRTDMTSSPKAIKQELVKDVIVPCYSYQSGVEEQSLVSEEITVTEGDVELFFLSEPSYDFRAVLDGVESGVTILESGSYYVKVQFNVSGTHELEIFGYHYRIVERYATKTLNDRGKTVKWENPLMSDMTMATDLAEWLGEHYAAGVEYEYSTRGNPELDANDIVYQANDFREGMKVKIYRQTLTFNQSFSGKVTARRMGG